MEANVGNYPENWGVGSFQAIYRLLAACFCQDIEPRLRQPLVKNHKQKGLFATNGMVTTSTFARPQRCIPLNAETDIQFPYIFGLHRFAQLSLSWCGTRLSSLRAFRVMTRTRRGRRNELTPFFESYGHADQFLLLLE
ncbi:hypothetical protein [Ensifer aridi]|uniref:hypothetical protein n=1 Tax=Ensifer aridi TaxID=1708715 RepID=UPI00047E9570|nr:hypothetical protein [Ensifer aridi]